jgi:hypothetical protein
MANAVAAERRDQFSHAPQPRAWGRTGGMSRADAQMLIRFNHLRVESRFPTARPARVNGRPRSRQPTLEPDPGKARSTRQFRCVEIQARSAWRF